MKAVFFVGNLSRGGAERVTVLVSEYLASNGCDVTILTISYAQDEYQVGQKVKRVALFNKVPKLHLRIIWKARAFLKKNDADVLVLMDSTASIFFVPACLGLKTKIIVSERNDPTHFGGKRITKALSDYFFCKADGFVFQTDEAKKYYSKKIGTDGTVIPNPLVMSRISTKSDNSRKNVFVNVARLEKQKNQEMLIRAFHSFYQRNRSFELHIFGDGALKGYLQSLINDLGLENAVTLYGNVPDIFDRICDATCFVLSSNYEGLPNSLMEAMAVGLPCISTDCPCGGPASLIEDGYNGVLVPVGESDALAAAMQRIAEDNDYSRLLGERARDISKTLDIEVIGKKWKVYIDSVVCGIGKHV